MKRLRRRPQHAVVCRACAVALEVGAIYYRVQVGHVECESCAGPKLQRTEPPTYGYRRCDVCATKIKNRGRCRPCARAIAEGVSRIAPFRMPVPRVATETKPAPALMRTAARGIGRK